MTASVEVVEWWLRQPPGYANPRLRLTHAYRPGGERTVCGKALGAKIERRNRSDSVCCIVCVAVIDGDDTLVRGMWGEHWRKRFGIGVDA